jgi:hypothetical protein
MLHRQHETWFDDPGTAVAPIGILISCFRPFVAAIPAAAVTTAMVTYVVHRTQVTTRVRRLATVPGLGVVVVTEAVRGCAPGFSA